MSARRLSLEALRRAAYFVDRRVNIPVEVNQLALLPRCIGESVAMFAANAAPVSQHGQQDALSNHKEPRHMTRLDVT